MKTVSYVVECLIVERPFIHEALYKGIINNSALAEIFLPEVEKVLKKPVKFSSVNMAIRRFAEKGTGHFNFASFDPKTDITVKNDLLALTIQKTDYTGMYVDHLFKQPGFLTFTNGLDEAMMIMHQDTDYGEVISDNIVKKRVDHLSGLSIKIPEDAVASVGLFYIITRDFAWQNIPIIDIISTYTELTVLVKEDDAARSLEIIRKLIKNKVT